MLGMDIQIILNKAGGVRAMADALGLTTQGVYKWKRVPAEHVFKVSELTGFHPTELRPDLYPRGTVFPKGLGVQLSANSQSVAALSG